MKRNMWIAALVLALVLLGGGSALAQGGYVHYVQPGETLTAIADSYGVSAQAIMTANSLTNADLIYVGQKLVIPSADGSATGGTRYTVKAGDTLGSIAWRFGTTVQALATANNLSNIDSIFVGQVLNVPGGGESVPFAPAPVYECGGFYTVAAGDTLSAIAWRYGVSVTALKAANNLSADTIYAGQQLCVPGTAAPSAGKAFYHTVAPGDTVTGLAARYGVSAGDIIQANNLSALGLIYVGQKLLIPGYAPPASKTEGVPPAPEYVEVQPPSATQPAWDGSVTVVKVVNRWVGAQTAEVDDPDGITTMIVRIVGDDKVPIAIKQGEMVLHGTAGTMPEFGLASFGFRGIPAGEYAVWVDRDKSEVVKAKVDPGKRALVEFRYVSVSEDPPPRSPTGWSGRIVRNTGGTTDANGVWSIIIVRTGVLGLPVSIRSQGNDFQATCYTGTKPEYGPGACDFGGLWPGTYTVTLEGAGIAVEVYVDGQGVAEVTFDKQ